MRTCRTHDWCIVYDLRMELLFADRSLEDLCASRARLSERYGAPVARAICVRLHEIEAAFTLGELRLLPHLHVRAPAGRPGVVHVDVVRPLYLAVRPAGPLAKTPTPTIDWNTPRPVVVLEITDAPDRAPLERRER